MTRASASTAAPGADDGFTLIEMIVALALLAMIAGLLASSVYGMRRVLAVVNRGEVTSTMLSARTYLRSALAQTAPFGGGAGQSSTDPALIGDAASLRLRTSFTPRGQVEGFYRVALELEPSASHRSAYDLVVHQTLIRTPPQDGTTAPAIPTQRARLLTGVRSLAIGYFGSPDETGEAPRWLDNWSSAGRLPRLVRITVAFPPGDERSWPALTLPLQLADDGGTPCRIRQPC